MIVGVVKDGLARVPLSIPVLGAHLNVEFIVDTGFEGDLTLPRSLMQRIGARPLFHTLRSLADGTLRECPLFDLVLDWLGEAREAQVLVLENKPLLGSMLFEGCQLFIDFREGGDVTIERSE